MQPLQVLQKYWATIRNVNLITRGCDFLRVSERLWDSENQRGVDWEKDPKGATLVAVDPSVDPSVDPGCCALCGSNSTGIGPKPRFRTLRKAESGDKGQIRELVGSSLFGGWYPCCLVVLQGNPPEHRSRCEPEKNRPRPGGFWTSTAKQTSPEGRNDIEAICTAEQFIAGVQKVANAAQPCFSDVQNPIKVFGVLILSRKKGIQRLGSPVLRQTQLPSKRGDLDWWLEVWRVSQSPKPGVQIPKPIQTAKVSNRGNLNRITPDGYVVHSVIHPNNLLIDLVVGIMSISQVCIYNIIYVQIQHRPRTSLSAPPHPRTPRRRAHQTATRPSILQNCSADRHQQLQQYPNQHPNAAPAPAPRTAYPLAHTVNLASHFPLFLGI